MSISIVLISEIYCFVSHHFWKSPCIRLLWNELFNVHVFIYKKSSKYQSVFDLLIQFKTSLPKLLLGDYSILKRVSHSWKLEFRYEFWMNNRTFFLESVNNMNLTLASLDYNFWAQRELNSLKPRRSSCYRPTTPIQIPGYNMCKCILDQYNRCQSRASFGVFT